MHTSPLTVMWLAIHAAMQAANISGAWNRPIAVKCEFEQATFAEKTWGGSPFILELPETILHCDISEASSAIRFALSEALELD